MGGVSALYRLNLSRYWETWLLQNQGPPLSRDPADVIDRESVLTWKLSCFLETQLFPGIAPVLNSGAVAQSASAGS